MKFSEFLKETAKPKAVNADDLLASIKDGVFTKDGSHLHVDGHFDCQNNTLTSLVGAPSHVGGDFSCNGNKLTSLVGAPSSVGGKFSCQYNMLTSLSGAPSSVGHSFDCRFNQLTSLVGAPSSVGGEFFSGNNKLTSLSGAPSSIGSYLQCDDNMNLVNAPLLSLLRIKKLKYVCMDDREVENIINKYLPNTRGNDAIMDCQNELLDAGFEEEAQL